MAEDYNNREPNRSKSFSKVKVKSELLSLELCDDDDSDCQTDIKFVQENVIVKREYNSHFITDSVEGEGDKDCYEDEGIFPDFNEASNFNSTGLLSIDHNDASAVHIMSTSEVIKTEQVNVLDNFYDESEYQKDETEVENNYDDNSNDPVDTLVEWVGENPSEYGPSSEASDLITKFSCPNCDLSFTRKYDLDEHKIFHQYKEDRSITCPLCDSKFHFEKNMKLHIKLVHKEALPPPRKKLKNGKLSFLCTLCKDVFQLPEQLQSHIEDVHSDEMPFKCAICELRFKTKTSLSIHIKLSHLNKLQTSGNKQAEPLSSAKKIVKSWTSTYSTIVSPNASLYTCDICHRDFQFKKLLRDHRTKTHAIRNVVFAKYQCEVCNRQFWKHTAHANHMRNAHRKTRRKKLTAFQKKKNKREYLKKWDAKNASVKETIKVEAGISDNGMLDK